MSLGIDISMWIIYFVSLYFSVFWLVTFIEAKQQTAKRISLKQYPFVSVLIPAHNEALQIHRSMRSVAQLDYPKEKYEVIVIDDGSTDTTAEQVKIVMQKSSSRNLFLLSQKKSGKAAALNYGLERAKGDFFACLDADSSVDKNALKAMLAIFEENDQQLAIVTPCMHVEQPKTLLQKFQRVEYIMAVFIQRLMGTIDCIYVAPGPFSLYRTEVIRKLGGFEQGNLTEDQEIAYRVQKHHYKIKQCPTAEVHTIAPRDMKGLYKQRNRWFKGSLLNWIKYRKLCLNRNYGDFGFFQMPLNLMNFILSLASIFFVGYFIGIPALKFLKQLILIRFDIAPYFKEIFSASFNILNINVGKFFVWYILFMITVVIFYMAHRTMNIRVREQGTLYLIPYFFVYYLVLSGIAVIVLVEFLLGKKQQW